MGNCCLGLATKLPSCTAIMVDLATMDVKGFISRYSASSAVIPSGSIASVDYATAFLGEDKFLIGGEPIVLDWRTPAETGTPLNVLASFNTSDLIRKERPLVEHLEHPSNQEVTFIQETANYITTNIGWFDKETLEFLASTPASPFVSLSIMVAFLRGKSMPTWQHDTDALVYMIFQELIILDPEDPDPENTKKRLPIKVYLAKPGSSVVLDFSFPVYYNEHTSIEYSELDAEIRFTEGVIAENLVGELEDFDLVNGVYRARGLYGKGYDGRKAYTDSNHMDFPLYEVGYVLFWKERTVVEYRFNGEIIEEVLVGETYREETVITAVTENSNPFGNSPFIYETEITGSTLTSVPQDLENPEVKISLWHDSLETLHDYIDYDEGYLITRGSRFTDEGYLEYLTADGVQWSKAFKIEDFEAVNDLTVPRGPVCTYPFYLYTHGDEYFVFTVTNPFPLATPSTISLFWQGIIKFDPATGEFLSSLCLNVDSITNQVSLEHSKPPQKSNLLLVPVYYLYFYLNLGFSNQFIEYTS